MTKHSSAVPERREHDDPEFPAAESGLSPVPTPPPIPDYLQDTYWWAYLHPKALHYFERKWVVNLILWGNMRKLTEAVLADITPRENARVLQVACVYGEFSNRLASHLEERSSQLELLDVAPIQLSNAREKLADHPNVTYHQQDSSAMAFPAGSFDQTVVFFLLHEQPEDVRRRTIEEAIRVTRPGGEVIFVDYHKPLRNNPMRYVMKPILRWLEPFAMDLWRAELTAFMPERVRSSGQIHSEYFFGELYQKVNLAV
jgi:ubiquinone/menaquinone biosynthesis C-methylase UbiE